MKFARRTIENAAATKTFGALRIERRVLATPGRTIAIANISTVSVGPHVITKPRVLYWLVALLFAGMMFGSMRTEFSFGPLVPTAFTGLLVLIMLGFVALALWPDDKTNYLLITANDGVLTRFTTADRAFLDEVRGILSDKINRGDEQMQFNINFERVQIENLASANDVRGLPPPRANGASHGGDFANGPDNLSDRDFAPAQAPRPGKQPPRRPANIAPPPNSNGSARPETFVDYSNALPAIVEMHRFYARQPGTQHLEQRLSELEMLMRAGTPTQSQKARLRELTGDMTQILNAYPQAVELFEHIGGLV